jgi:hypothetical protein
MGSRVTWLIEGRVIETALSGTLTIEELQEYCTLLSQHLDTGVAPLIHVICDATQLEKFPLSLDVMNNTFKDTMRHPRIGWSIVITSNRAISFFSSMIIQIAKARFRIFKTREEGLKFLSEMDSTLPVIVSQ